MVWVWYSTHSSNRTAGSHPVAPRGVISPPVLKSATRGDSSGYERPIGCGHFILLYRILRSAVVWHFPVAIPPSLGVWAVFMSVLVTQLGVPIPAAPMLILGGTMAAMGQTSYA